MTEHELDTLLRDYGGRGAGRLPGYFAGPPAGPRGGRGRHILQAVARRAAACGRGAPAAAGRLTARQCAIDRYRALLRRGETLPLDDRDDAELAVALESHLESRELMAQIMALPPPDGELFLRRYLYGETAAQLGARFAMPAATVRTRLHRARLALQKLLKEG